MLTSGRIPFGAEEDNLPWYSRPEGEVCPDCGVTIGDAHEAGCDKEQCPICGDQLIACSHAEEFL